MVIRSFRTLFHSSTWTFAASVLAILLLSMGSPGFATASYGCGAYMLCNPTECLDNDEAEEECEAHADDCSVVGIACREPDDDEPEGEYCLICIYAEKGGQH